MFEVQRLRHAANASASANLNCHASSEFLAGASLASPASPRRGRELNLACLKDIRRSEIRVKVGDSPQTAQRGDK